MNGIAEFVVKVADLVEAEGRSARSALREDGRELRRSAGELAWALVIVCAGGLLATIGVLLWLAAVYLAVSEAAGPAWGAVAAGAIGVGLGLACMVIFRKMVSA
jgi:hypothetical protein